MAWDKVTKIDSIAKRKPRTKVNAGLLVEYRDAYSSAAWAKFVVPNTNAQMTVTIGRSGKMRRDIRTGNGGLVTNFAGRTSTRGR